MEDIARKALDIMKSRGVSYGDIRILETKRESLGLRNGIVSEIDQTDSLGFGIRVLYDGAWGFASSSGLEAPTVERMAEEAVRIAKASARLKKERVELPPVPVYQDTWITPIVLDPFEVSFSEKVGLLQQIDALLRKDPRIAQAYSSLTFVRKNQWLATTEGSLVHQVLTHSSGGYEATAVGSNESQTRSFPMSHGGQCASMGYELIPSLKLVENAERIRDEVIALLSAKECPQGTMDVILDSTQLALQIHESCGHPTELDRVFGAEESYAGSSFLTPEKYKKFQYGSEKVTLFADNTLPTSLGTIGYDDDGVRAQRWFLVKNGLFCGYQSNREWAAKIGEAPTPNCRAQSYDKIPIIRNTTICLQPGEAEVDDLFQEVKNGLYMENNKCWSIDQKRLNFQFACEIGWEIKDGKRGALVKNPSYQGITPEFWGSCVAVANEKYWRLWGVPNCGKGEPPQTIGMSHGASPALFRAVHVGAKM